MARVRPTLDVSPQSTTPVGAVECFSSGAVLLDLVLGHGWPIGRIINIVGDRSSGKTLLAIEACANFARRFGALGIAASDITIILHEPPLDNWGVGGRPASEIELGFRLDV